jgi:hypothetical protein
MSRAELHQLRGTAADSSIARAIIDSLVKVQAVAHPPPYENFDSRMVYERDTTALKALLSRDSVDSRVILQLVYSVRGYVTVPITAYRGAASMDSLRPFVRTVVDLVSPVIERHPAIVRDSMLSYHVATIAFLDVDRALDVAREIPTPRFRDRAIAEVAVRLARINADSAQRVAASVQDSIARGLVFGPLAVAAVSGARLSLASDLADRATGEARVRAFHALATKERDNVLLADARRHSLLALASLNPVVRCNGCLIVHALPPPEPILVSSGMDARLIHDVVVLAVELGQRDQLIRWATSRESPKARAIAHLAMVEAMSRHLLGWRPMFPMH